MKKNSEILVFLTNLDSDLFLNNVIKICQSIALSYLHCNYRKIYKFLQNEELSFEEFALDAIAPLFVREKEDQNISIRTSFNNWQPVIKTEEDALYFLNKIVASRVEQHIYSLLKEEDPFFSKILDSVNYLIKTQGYKKSQSLGKTYIIKSDDEISDTLFISQQEFENLPTHLFANKKKLFSNLINYLQTETKFVSAIPLNDLVYKLKHINFSEYVLIKSSEMTRKQFEMDEIVDFALKSALKKLDNSYTANGKLNNSESKSIRSALTDISVDLKNGGINPGLYDYLAPYIKDLSKEAYKDNYHNILEYLVRVTKSVIADNLQEKN